MNFSNFKFNNVPGIYKIVNLINNNLYIGSSVAVHKRISRHVWDLRKKVHCNSHMQRAYDLYNEESFSVELIEYCEEARVIEQEQLLDRFFEARI